MSTESSTILVVDDTESNIDMLMAMLKQYDVVPATSGEDALEIVKQEKIDLILLDIMMEGLDGFEVCRRLKRDETTKHIPVIFITAKSDEDSIEEGYSIGGIDYVTKPFKPKELLARVKTHLELKHYREFLESKVEEETQKRLKQEKALIQSAKLAEIGDSVHAITHQWKQPLSGMGMLVMALKDDMDCGEVSKDSLEKHIEHMKERLDFLNETISDFKSFFKEDRVPHKFNIKREIEKVIDIITPQLRSLNIKVSFVSEDRDISVRGFKNEFKQVILNLINNAGDAIKLSGKKEGGFINIDIKEDSEYLNISIADNGGGVSEKIGEKIFDKLFTTKGEEGSGIGLSLSKIIIEEHHKGKLSFVNQKDGAVFCIKLPKSSICE